MTVSITIAALLKSWTSLPEWAGAEWPNVYWRLLDAMRAYLDAPDEEARAQVANRVLAEVRQSPPTVQEAIRQEMLALQEQARTRGPHEPAPEADPLAVLAQARRLFDPEAVARYTDVHAPAQVQTGKRFAVIVGLTRSPSDDADAQNPQELQARLNQLIKVVLTPREPVEVIGERAKSLRVEPERDSEPVVFYLRVRKAGTQSILLDFYDAKTLIASQSLSLEAIAEASTETLAKPAGVSLRLGDYLAPYPDLILRITTLGNRLTYHLHFSDTRMQTIEGEALRADPRTFRQNLMKEIENLRQAKDANGAPIRGDEIARAIERIGQRLYRELFPEALRREYRRFRDGVRTLQIISDEPWIPWELVKPYELDGSDGPAFNDDFLCARFDLARWVMPGTAPAAEIQVRSLACVAPQDSGLAAAQDEREYVRSLATRTGVQDATPADATRAQILSLFEGQAPISLWHFACHGDYRNDDPDQSPLALSGGAPLRPNDLIGPDVERRLASDRPFVFLNACRAGSLGLSIAGLGGWAKVLVGDCRVGALIAPLWEVTDAPAQNLAEAFYAQTRQPGCTLAQAMRQARALTRKAYPHDPTWLAYSLYAHPNARLKWSA